jgi:hypothetical protein
VPNKTLRIQPTSRLSGPECSNGIIPIIPKLEVRLVLAAPAGVPAEERSALRPAYPGAAGRPRWDVAVGPAEEANSALAQVVADLGWDWNYLEQTSPVQAGVAAHPVSAKAVPPAADPAPGRAGEARAWETALKTSDNSNSVAGTIAPATRNDVSLHRILVIANAMPPSPDGPVHLVRF